MVMKKLLLFLLLMLANLVQAQDKMPTPDQVRMMIAQSITDLKVAPEAVATIHNIKVPNGQDSIPIRICQPASDRPLPVIYLVHGGAWGGLFCAAHDAAKPVTYFVASSLQRLLVSQP